MQLVGVAWAEFVPIAIIIISKNVDMKEGMGTTMLKGPMLMCVWESTADTILCYIVCAYMYMYVNVHTTNMYTMSLHEWVGMPAILHEEEVIDCPFQE